ncbi:MAG: lysylphosphatidylglycerol synthase domain-containing protein [Spirochaetota bacterium]|nr:lysylphosphatidylglycerol synthase domain-containing protein [Spirochaetota bacterium]
MKENKFERDVQTIIRKWLPWILTISIFIYLFHRIPIVNIIDAIEQADIALFLPILIFCVLFFYLIDTYIQTFLFRSFGTDVNFRDMAPIRGATYLIVLLNYVAGQGGMVLLMNRWKNLAISRATSVVIFSLFVDYYTLLALCLAGAFSLPDVDLANFFDLTEAGHLVKFIVLSWMAIIFFLIFFLWILPHSNGLEWFKKNELLASFREAHPLLYIQVGLVKCVMFVVGIICIYFALRAFHIYVPLIELSVMLPLVWFIGSIPITVMRMGTTQAAMVWLIVRYAESDLDIKSLEAVILAFSLLWETGFIFARFAIGSISFSLLPRNLWVRKGNVISDELKQD